MGFVHTYEALVTLRFFLGVFEAGVLPGIVYLTSMYYKRHEFQTRMSFFFCSTLVGGAFGGVGALSVAHRLAMVSPCLPDGADPLSAVVARLCARQAGRNVWPGGVALDFHHRRRGHGLGRAPRRLLDCGLAGPMPVPLGGGKGSAQAPSRP